MTGGADAKLVRLSEHAVFDLSMYFPPFKGIFTQAHSVDVLDSLFFCLGIRPINVIPRVVCTLQLIHDDGSSWWSVHCVALL